MKGDGADVTDLVAAALRGDESAWNEIIDQFASLVYAVILRHRLYGADADDICQIVWLRLLEHLHELREPRALPRWLIATTRNECLRLISASRRVRPYDPQDGFPDGAADQGEPADGLLLAECREALLGAVAELPERQRELILLLIDDGEIPYAEISRRLGMPLGSIGPTRARAVQRLREVPQVAALSAAGRTLEELGGGDRDVAAVG